jgi:glycosyltransferase involved in cell wall biosynthesis
LQKVIFATNGIKRRIDDFRNLSRYDLVFIQKEALPFGTTIIEKLFSSKKPVIYDFDDAVYLMNPSKTSLIPFLRTPSKIATIIKLSECVIAGNQYLADYATKYNCDVHIIPTCIDTDYYIPKHKREERKRIVIGWIGSQSTISYLVDIKGVLKKLCRKYDVIFKIVANAEIDLNIETEFKTWRLRDELVDLRSFDIGIMPLPNNEWTRSKCGYKIIQYMAVGKSVVASPVGVNKEIINDGVNGFLAKNENEWKEKLSVLIEDYDLRKKISVAGRQVVEDRYSLKINAPKLLNLLFKVSGKNKPLV